MLAVEGFHIFFSVVDHFDYFYNVLKDYLD